MANEAEFLEHIARRLKRLPLSAPGARPNSVLPDVPTIPPDALVMRFAGEAERVGARVHLCASHREVAEAIRNLILVSKAQTIARWSPDALTDWDLGSLAGECDWLLPDTENFLEKAAFAEIGMTGVDAAIAETGTLVLRADSHRPRVVSLLPRIHIALVMQSQIVATMGEAMAHIRAASPAVPSAVQFITGPSRSADIENDLSIGVHGPAIVNILILRQE